MADLHGFDASTVEPRADFTPIPAGKYLAAIIDSELKSTKNGAGSYLQLVFEILEGPQAGRKLWARLNLVNPNAQAVQIAQAELSSICRAVGVMAPNDSLELHNLPLTISVACKKRSDTGEITNEVKGYTKKDTPQAPTPPPPPPHTLNGKTDSKSPPWRKS